MNVYYFEGDEIDIDPYVFEEVMLNMPIKALCSESCKGICPCLRQEPNVEECGCEKTGTALGEKLKQFFKRPVRRILCLSRREKHQSRGETKEGRI